ncbi:MAG: VOC family protein [Candidatus Dormibacterales bacterium]
MAETGTAGYGKPIWADLSTTDRTGARTFYSTLFGWSAEPSPDPAAGGYAVAQLDGRDVAGIGGVQGEGQPSAWSVYIGTADASETARRVEAAGGKVVAPPFDIMDQGRMGVFQDPSGAFISVWQPIKMMGAQVARRPGSVSWNELNARGLASTKPFYERVFGWATKTSPFGEGEEYTEWQLGGESVAGGMEMARMVPAEVPSHWLVYFQADDVAATTERARELGATVVMPATDYPGGKFSIVRDPQGAVFGLMSG